MKEILLQGKWVDKDSEISNKGILVRSKSLFRSHIENTDEAIFAPEKDRYHLYVSYACPWAHRTLMTLFLKGLENTISYSILSPEKKEGDWEFADDQGALKDSLNNVRFLREIYLKAERNYSGNVTVPVLWDRKLNTIVNNESRDIVRIFDTEFEEFSTTNLNLYPIEISDEIDLMIEKIYHTINNSVYKVGYARTQATYEESVKELFLSLDNIEKILDERPFLMGNILTEADICLFPTLIRFDLVYYSLFKCSIKHLYEYKNIWNYIKRMYKIPEINQTCNFDHIKRFYFKSSKDLNPGQIVPLGPDIETKLIY